MRIAYMLALIFAIAPLASTEKSDHLTHVEAYFSPKDNIDAKLISLIEQETSSIKAAVYCLTHRGIINALMDAKKRGVQVELIIDPFTVKARAPLRRMAQSGMAIYVWDPQQKQMTDRGKLRTPLMHNKFCVFSKLGVVWTGSFNFTSEGALANQENVIVVHGVDQVAPFIEQFDSIKAEGCKSLRDFFSIPKKNKSKNKKETNNLP
jgi:phosphatidylserine/phosphatidylglycerophosphate/cardiolipin synthase-like enzyme